MTENTPRYGSPPKKNADGEVVAYGPHPQCLIRNGWDVPPATCRTLQQANRNLIRV